MRQPDPDGVNKLVAAGYAPLVAMVLASRGLGDPQKAKACLSCDCPLPDPYRMRDMDLAAGRLALAVDRGEKIAVFGDYDVDGITATCLLTGFIRSIGGDCVPYIPGRLEEGYGLNPIAIRQLHGEGVKLIVTVDCGITAVEEAKLCAELGIDLVVTDHHECKQELPKAIAVVDAHRIDCAYPHKDLSGVGVAFKLASAICGSQEQVLENYADMVCLGTVADVMPLQGENRVFVARGLEALKNTNRPGLLALMKLAGCDKNELTATSVSYTLAPRINAAGRMGKIDLALNLLLTEDPEEAQHLAEALCDLNRERQAVEAEIYEQAVQMLPQDHIPDAIVLADETWHQGVVGIVSSRIAEEYCCPTFLICLDGEHGKASSRSYGGFNLFSALTTLAPLLESYGGHELAAGFTITRENIPAFREQVCRLARNFYKDDGVRTVLENDCVVRPELLTVANIASLSQLEPCGNGCAKAQLVVEGMMVEKMSQVGSGRHMRLRLRSGWHTLQGIWFSTNPQTAAINEGDLVDVAFLPQINEFRGERTPQLNVVDIRPHCAAACSMETGNYSALCRDTLKPAEAAALLPDRAVLGTVWRYLQSCQNTEIHEEPACLCRKIVRWSGNPLSLEMLLVCLDVFADVGLLRLHRERKFMTIHLIPTDQKADLQQSATMQKLQALKEA